MSTKNPLVTLQSTVRELKFVEGQMIVKRGQLDLVKCVCMKYM